MRCHGRTRGVATAVAKPFRNKLHVVYLPGVGGSASRSTVRPERRWRRHAFWAGQLSCSSANLLSENKLYLSWSSFLQDGAQIVSTEWTPLSALDVSGGSFCGYSTRVDGVNTLSPKRYGPSPGEVITNAIL